MPPPITPGPGIHRKEKMDASAYLGVCGEYSLHDTPKLPSAYR